VNLPDLLASELRNRSVPVSPAIEQKLVVYIQELERWNRAVNLTALRGVELVRRLVADPVWIGQQLQLSGTLADVGSGNGSPAIPLCLTRPIAHTDLIEARVRRAAFLRHITQILDIKRVNVRNTRLEELEASDAPVDWFSLQAVHPTAMILQAMKRLSSPTTRVVWITSVRRAPVPAADSILVPGGNTRAWVFRLDQS
jgi:16S rRNA (guanine(527)-N(7))-methyltransferase RsmG